MMHIIWVKIQPCTTMFSASGPVIRAALHGVGLAFAGEDLVMEHLRSGALVRVLEDWCPPFPGFFLYYPSRRQQPAALAALIDTLRATGPAAEVVLTGGRVNGSGYDFGYENRVNVCQLVSAPVR